MRKSIKEFIRNRKLLVASLVLVIALLIVSIIFFRRPESATVSDVPAAEPKVTEVNAAEKPDIGDFGLEISKIDVWVPIIDRVDEGNKNQYLKAIERGVALSKNYAQNPTENGSLFIFGHSRYYKDKPGDYKEVFEDLNLLKAGDQFTVYFERQSYVYEVFESKLVANNDLSIMDATPKITDDKTVTLMTCWPPGTTDKRWAVFARQI